MVDRLRRGSHAQHGFTLIEVLVVVLVVGILAAIAIPSFLGQKVKATDASAKELARTAQTTTETYQSDHSGTYTGMSPTLLHEYERGIQTAEGNNNAWLEAAESKESGAGYKVTAVAVSGDKFTITRTSSGTTTRTCEAKAVSVTGGCPTGSW